VTSLPDANVLIALLVPDHVHHGRALATFGAGQPVATCPLTQGAFVRFILREGGTARQAIASLTSLTASSGHVFLPDDLAYDIVRLDGVVGHRQVTDAYLAGLARHHGIQLATLDRGLAALHDDVAVLIE
jgi:toxin-antitoxin system PIN domain toxin